MLTYAQDVLENSSLKPRRRTWDEYPKSPGVNGKDSNGDGTKG